MKLKGKPAKTGKKQAGGRFKPGVSGNPAGRPEGSRNKATLALQAFLDGEAATLSRKIVNLAKKGNLTALQFCLSRILPPKKDRPINLEFPKVETGSDTHKALSFILERIGQGEITPSEGQCLAGIIEGCRRAIELSEVMSRLERLEQRLEERVGSNDKPQSAIEPN